MAPTSSTSRSGSWEDVTAASGSRDLTAHFMRAPSHPGQGPSARAPHTSDLVFRSPFLALILPLQSS